MRCEIDWKKTNPTQILNWILIISVVAIILSSLFFSLEIYTAKKNCNKLNGNYNLKYFNHFCNDKPFFQYTDGSWNWKIDWTINFSSIG